MGTAKEPGSLSLLYECSVVMSSAAGLMTTLHTDSYIRADFINESVLS